MTNNLVQVNESPLAIQPHADTSILAVISRAAADPACDIDKMERLLQMHERMESKRSEASFNAAMAQMQSEMPTVGEGAQNSHTKNTYATLDDINRVVKPVMQRHGFAVTFKVDHQASGISITGILMHSAGHREQTTLLLPIDVGAGRNAVQAVGSSTTYGKRYVMCAMLNITTGDAPDDDGLGSIAEPLVTPAQAKQIDTLLAKCGEKTKKGFSAMYGTADQVPKVNFDGVIARLNNSIAKAKEAE